MPNYNYICLIGNLTYKPDLSYTPKGVAVCKLRMAVNKTWTNSEGEKVKDTLYIDVTVWKKQAENCATFLTKGSGVMVTGELKLEKWEAKEGGKRSKIKLIARQVLFIGKTNEQKIDEQDAARYGPENVPDGTPPAEADQPEDSKGQTDADVPS